LSSLIAFLPIRKGSQRVVKKNVRDFANIEGGLTFIKLKQLISSKKIDKIIVSTDDEKAIKIAKAFNSNKITIFVRPKHLATSSTLTDELINYVPSVIKDGIVLWTHVTSPFVDGAIYDDAISKYLDNLDSFDSLMSVTKIQKFLWNNHNALNYDRAKEKWPRTQTIEPLFEVNSGLFIADIDIYRKLKDRIGKKPMLYKINEIQAFDIDWGEDFDIAEAIWSRYGKI